MPPLYPIKSSDATTLKGFLEKRISIYLLARNIDLWYNGGMATVNRNSKSILAKVLACENITVMHSNEAQTATFDIRNRVLTLPLFDEKMTNELYDMLVAHEVGHALYTPYSEEDEKSVLVGGRGKAASTIGGEEAQHIVFDYLNVVEDARIDRLMKEKFAGIRRDYHIGYRELHERDFFKTKGKDLNKMSFIDRINLHFKIGSILENSIQFNENEMEFVKRIENAISYDDVVNIVSDLWAYCKENPEETEQQTPSEPEQSPDGEKSGKIVNNENGEIDNTNFLTVDSTKMQEMMKEQDNPDAKDAPENDDSTAKTVGIPAPMRNNKGKLPSECSTQQSFEAAKNTLIDLNNQVHYNQLCDANLDNMIVSYDRILNMFKDSRQITPKPYLRAAEDYRSFEKTSKNSVNILIKQFMMKKAANESSRASVSKSGSIDMDRLVNYKFTDDIFLRIKNVKRGKSHGLVLFMDWSGSMSPIMGDTLKQLFQICLFCKKINIPFVVYGFTSVTEFYDYNILSDADNYESKVWKNKKKENHCLSDFQLLEILSSDMKSQEFSEMMENLFAFMSQANARYDSVYYHTHIPHMLRLGGTPLNEAIVAAMNIVPLFKKNKNIDIVHTVFLTDGEANGGYFYGSSYYARNFIVRGNLTFEMPKNENSTTCLLKMFREICGCKAIGIFLEGRKKGDMCQYTQDKYFTYSSFDARIKNNKMFNEHGFVVADHKCHGYDEMFIIRGNSSIDDEDIEEILEKKKTKVAIRNAFIKTMDNRTTSRIMLNRFIELIATE